MGFIDSWLGEWPHESTRYMTVPSRTITVSDLLEMKAELAKGCKKATINLVRGEDAPGPEITEPLQDASDEVIGRLALVGWTQVMWPSSRPTELHPIVMLRLGAREPARLTSSLHLLSETPALTKEDSERQLEQLEAAMGRMMEVLRTAGKRSLGRRQVRDVLRLVFRSCLLALGVWFAVTVWPSIAVLLVGVLALVCVDRVGIVQIDREVEKRVGYGMHYVKIRPITRNEYRTRKEVNRRGIKVFVGTLIGTAVVTYIATVAANQLDLWPF